MNVDRHISRLMLATTLAVLASGGEAAALEERMIVFVQDSGSSIAKSLEGGQLASLISAAEQLGIETTVVDAGSGAPAEVGITPCVVYQNHRGRSFFQGRYGTPEKLVHFLRTSRALPPLDGGGSRQRLLVHERGRSRVGAPVIVTELSGARPRGDFDPGVFRAEAEAAVASGLQHLRLWEQVELGPTDRLFYFDFYPYLSEQGELSVGVRLFSQFHCTEPVFERLSNPFRGRWEDRNEIFAAAASVLEREMFEVIATSPIGDGFDPVDTTVPVTSWDDLGLSLPVEKEAAVEVVASLDLPRRWTLDATTADSTRLFFRFPPPLERYSGEVRNVTAELELGPNGELATARGWVEVETFSLTMGDPMLDDELHTKLLKAADFPVSRVEISPVASVEGSSASPLSWGRLTPLSFAGEFEMMGSTVRVEIRGQVEPVFGDDGEPRLHVAASYSIGLWNPFRLEGPEGPKAARDTVEIFLDCLLRPK